MFSGLEVAQRQSRRLTALASFTLQVALVGAMLVYPLFRPQGLTDMLIHYRIPLPLPEIGERPQTAQPGGHAGAHPFLAPIVVPHGTPLHPAPAPGGQTEIGTPPGIGVIGIGAEEVLDFISSEGRPPVLQGPSAVKRVVRTSNMMQGLLIHKVEPPYPRLAITARVEGSVRIKAIISRQGTIEQAEVVSGSPLLTTAALDAVRQWRYRPYVLNNDPVEVETQITVKFVLGH